MNKKNRQMKKINKLRFAATLVTLMILSVINVNGQWISTKGPFGGSVNCIAVSDTSMFIGTGNNVQYGGVFISSDNYSKWELISNSLPADLIVTSIIISDHNILISTENEGIFYTNNLGNTWISKNNGLPVFVRINKLAVRDSVIYAFTNGNNVYSSVDMGDNWLPFDNGMEIGLSLNAAVVDSNIIYTATNNGRIYKNIKSSNIWIKDSINYNQPFTVNDLAVKNNFLYAATSIGVFKSNTQNFAWNLINEGLLANTSVFDIYTADSALIAATNNGVYIRKYTDTLWQLRKNGLPDTKINTIFKRGAFIYAGTDETGIYYTTNNGINWYPANTGLCNSTVYSIEANSDFLYSGAANGLSVYDFNLNKWSNTTNEIPFDGVLSLACKNNRVFAGTTKSGVYFSSNNGTNWSKISGNYLLSDGVASLAYNGDKLFAAEENVIITNDAGNTWTTAADLSGSYCETIIADSNMIFAGSYFGDLYKSDDNGITWSKISAFGRKLLSMAKKSDNLYVGCEFKNLNDTCRLFYSPDNGISWQDKKLGSLLYLEIRAIAVAANKIFVGLGLDYNVLNNTFLLYSEDNGNSWNNYTDNLPRININSLKINGNYLYAATEGKGIWKRPLSDFVGISENSEIVSTVSVFPNPLADNMHFSYELKKDAKVKLNIFDIAGRLVNTLIDENQTAGKQQLDFDASNLNAGIYYYQLIVGDYISSGKLIVAR